MEKLIKEKVEEEERVEHLFFKMLAVLPQGETMKVVAKALCTFFAHIMDMHNYDGAKEEEFLKSINQQIKVYRKAFKFARKL